MVSDFKILLLLACSIVIVACQQKTREFERYTERLRVVPLNKNDKSLFDFEFRFGHPANLDQIAADNYLISRSILESIFIGGNSRHIKIDSACGSINPVFLENAIIGEKRDFPENGVKIYMDKGSNYEFLLESLNEIFRFTKQNIRQQNHFKVSGFGIGQRSMIEDDSFIFAQDPSDFICSDNIEKLQRMFPCHGKSGLISLIDQNMLFRSDYVSISSELKYNQKLNQFEFKLNIKAVMNEKSLGEQLILKDEIKKCSAFMSSDIFLGQSRHPEFSIKTGDITGLEYSFKERDDSKIQNSLKSTRYNSEEWFSFKGNLIHEIENKNSIDELEIIQHEYFIWQFQPQLSKIRILLGDQQQDVTTLIRPEIQIIRDESYLLKFQYKLKPKTKIRFIIPIDKLMKSFENYPHDPQRGHDLISTPILFRKVGDLKIHEFTSSNTVMMLPEPDFSMPFNIITYVCVLMGYVYLIIFSVSTMKTF